jgi:hypothetical protein
LVTTKDVPPGGVGEVKATFKTKGYNGTARKSVTVETNDPKNKQVRLTLTGKVVAEVTVVPRYVNFGSVLKDESREPKKLEIEFLKGKNIEIKEVKSETPQIIVKQVKQDASGAEYSVSLAEDVPVGRVAGQIVIRTNSKKDSEVRVAVHAFVQGNVSVTPQVVTLGIIRPGEPVTREVTLKGKADAGFTVKEVKASSESITSEVSPGKEGDLFKITVTYNPGKLKKGRISEKVTIVTQDKNGQLETVQLPVYGAIRPKSDSSKK